MINNDDNLPHVGRRARISGSNRAALGAKVKRAYEEWGLGVRQIAEATGRSYGFVHRLLIECGVTMRGRGGDRRGKTALEHHHALRGRRTKEEATR